jgi:N-carbamoyl-L-amino-acid hydrolase
VAGKRWKFIFQAETGHGRTPLLSEAHDLFPIDTALLEALMEQVSSFGDTGDGGVDRPALSDNHKAARDWLCSELRERGYTVLVDNIGNVFGCLDLAGPDAPRVMVGSHLDSQPKGGRFDGAYGVVVALTAVETWRREAAECGIAPSCNYVIVDWMNEEGARFQPSLLGSSVYAGSLTRDFALARTDRDGKTVEQELLRTGYLGTDEPPQPDCFLEVHIEGDTALEQAGKRIAPFVRHWGALKIRIEVIGQQNHTGPTPMEDRHDAVLGAAYIIAKVRELADTAAGTLYTSVARVDISPNSPNIVPGKAVLFVELRAPEPDMLEWSEAQLKAALPTLAENASVEAQIIAIDHRPAGKFDQRVGVWQSRVLRSLSIRGWGCIRFPVMMPWPSTQSCPRSLLQCHRSMESSTAVMNTPRQRILPPVAMFFST